MDTSKGQGSSKFKSKWGFILACVGSAVGMANVWGFPYRLGSYGGGAFLLIYLFFVVVFGYVGLSAEYAIGRRSKTGTVGSYKNAWKSGGKSEVAGEVIGWAPLIGSMCIAIGYAVIVSYSLKAAAQSFTGSLMTVDTDTWFDSFSLAEFSVIPYHLIVVVGTLATLLLGADSIEKSNKIMMPAFFVLFIVLAIRVAFLPGAVEGYKFMFIPRWEHLLNPETWVWASAQAFFSLSLTGSGMIVYGSYLSDKEDVVDGAKWTAIFDTIAAIIAALVIIPACFAYGFDVGAGPGLLFVTLPYILQNMPLGRIFAMVLFTAVVFAGVSSLQNMFEVVAESVMKKFPKLKRIPMLVILAVVCFGIGAFMNPIYKWGPWMDFVSIYIQPIGATMGAISWFWIMKKEDLMDEINKGSKIQHGDKWYNVGRYLYVPFAVLLSLYSLIFQVAL
jgi:NSS family neurotransmitter:Na+ symporter